ncbi:MAG TPA: PEGA domain-containing protein [Candidatus Saccharimonadales bacterium]|nr:PEGA domain-containing protein [Candidatus Saccharimonadales bacterium]
MDFINPKKQRRHKIQLLVGYGLIAIALILTTIILLFSAYGYGLKKGQVIQNGLVFVSTNPSPAKIYLNGLLNSATTNARLQLPAGQYTLKLQRNGYRTWVRSLGVEGGSVERFDYPFLFPTKLVTTTLQQFSAQPALALQSPDRRWLLVQKPESLNDFWEYDLNNLKHLASTLTTVSIPSTILTANKPTISWQLVSWSTDNQHIILQRQYQGGSEYILFNRQTPADSVNLTTMFNLDATTTPSFNNNKYNQFYLFDSSSGALSTASLSTPQPTIVLSSGVLAYKTYGNDVIIYATTDEAPSGQVNIDIRQGSTTYQVRREPIGGQYLVNITQYSGSWYAVIGATNDSKVYIYQNPMSYLSNQPKQPLVPIAILKVNQPNYVDFSASAQFVVAESGSTFATYDIENNKTYSYNVVPSPVVGSHATWMDGDRLLFVSGGQVIVFDYDGANQQRLEPAIDGSTPFFDQSYKWLYTFAPAPTLTTADQLNLTSTALRLPADQ